MISSFEKPTIPPCGICRQDEIVSTGLYQNIDGSFCEQHWREYWKTHPKYPQELSQNVVCKQQTDKLK